MFLVCSGDTNYVNILVYSVVHYYCDIIHEYTHLSIAVTYPGGIVMKNLKWIMIILMSAITALCFSCAQADTLSLPEGLKEIEEEAFYGDTSVTEVILPDSVETIGPRAFANSGLRCIHLSSGLTSIADDAFDGITAMHADVEENTWAAEWWDENEWRFWYDEGAMPKEYFNYTILSDDTVRIDNYIGPRDVVNVDIPKYIDSKKVTIIGKNAFPKSYGLRGTLTIPNSVTIIDDSAFSNCSFSGDLIIPDSVQRIGWCAFSDCYDFNGSLKIGNNVKIIDMYAFKGCSGFTGDLIIPDSVTRIREFAFEGCYGFNGDLIIGNSVEIIDMQAFRFCFGFTGNLIIPDSVTAIRMEAFSECSGFNGSLTLGNNIETIECFGE